jgi:hypothetical protein
MATNQPQHELKGKRSRTDEGFQARCQSAKAISLEIVVGEQDPKIIEPDRPNAHSSADTILRICCPFHDHKVQGYDDQNLDSIRAMQNSHQDDVEATDIGSWRQRYDTRP